MPESLPQVEEISKPRFILMITRHAERTPSGALTEEGVVHSGEKGERFKEDAEVLVGYASDEKSRRTVATSDLISEASGVASPVTGAKYRTRVVPGIQYNILQDRFPDLMKKGKKLIDEKTIHDLNLPEATVLEELPPEKQKEAALVRQKNQVVGFQVILENPEAVRTLASGLAKQISKEQEVAERYDRMREHKQAPIKKQVVFNTVTHGMFVESLIIETATLILEGGERIQGKDIIDNPEFGGFIQPAESVGISLDNHLDFPDEIPLTFYDRTIQGKVVLDKTKLMNLMEENGTIPEVQK